MSFFRRNRSPLAAPRKPKQSRVGKATETIRLHGPDKSALRERVYLRANGFCELRLDGCGGYTPWKDGHLVHIKSVGSGGPDTDENCKWGCFSCHIKSHNCDGKPIREKYDGKLIDSMIDAVDKVIGQ